MGLLPRAELLPGRADRARCSGRSLLLTTLCSLLTAHYSLLTTHCSLLTAHCSLLATHYSLLTSDSFYQIDDLYRAPCLCKFEEVRRGLSYLLGMLLGLLLLLAVWVLSSCKWRLDEAGVTPLPMRLGRDLWPGLSPLLACVSLLDLASDVIVLLTFLRLQQWGLICTMALLLGVAWGVMLRTIASELPASRRSLSLREVGSPPGLGLLSTPRSRAGSTSASQISEAISEASCGASPCGSRRCSTSPGDTTTSPFFPSGAAAPGGQHGAGPRPAPPEDEGGGQRAAMAHARRLTARLRSMLRGAMAQDWAGMAWLTSARLTLARLESAPMFCLLMVLISVEGFRVVVEDLQLL